MKVLTYEEAKADRDNPNIYMVNIGTVPMTPIISMTSIDWNTYNGDSRMIFLQKEEAITNDDSLHDTRSIAHERSNSN